MGREKRWRPVWLGAWPGAPLGSSGTISLHHQSVESWEGPASCPQELLSVWMGVPDPFSYDKYFGILGRKILVTLHSHPVRTPRPNFLGSWGEGGAWEAAGRRRVQAFASRSLKFPHQCVTLAVPPRDMQSETISPHCLAPKGDFPGVSAAFWKFLRCPTESLLKIVLSPCMLPVRCGSLLLVTARPISHFLSWGGPGTQGDGET